MDTLEKEKLRQKMAMKMGIFLQNQNEAECVSSHWYADEQPCELCQSVHANEVMVIKNRAGRTIKVALSCLKEMIRFQVVEVLELSRWLRKLPELRAEEERRQKELVAQRAQERKRLEKRVIVRKKPSV